MKKLIISLTVFIFPSLFFVSQVFSQQPGSVSDPSVSVPPAPEAAALKEYVDIPISEYTGTAGVSIPLYTIQSKEVSIPISLSYHSAGNRVSEEASWVGLGWSLNAGGVISREIKDKDDFGFEHEVTQVPLPGYYTNFDNQIDKLPGDPLTQDPFSMVSFDPIPWGQIGLENFTIWVSHLLSYDEYLGNDGNIYNPTDLCDFREIDAEPDLFTFNFMGYSGKFVLNKTKSSSLYLNMG